MTDKPRKEGKTANIYINPKNEGLKELLTEALNGADIKGINFNNDPLYALKLATEESPSNEVN